METAQKKQRIETDAAEGGPPTSSLSPFNLPDLIIKIADKKLYINREDLKEVSPVFRTMLTADFKEKDAHQIKLPDKDPTTFALFLRHTLPGFEGLILPEETARLILPLVHEYQTDKSLLKIDRVLAARMERKKYTFSPDELIDEMLKAELYTLPTYLTACIVKASALSHKKLEVYPSFDDVSDTTKYKIFLMRCTEMESKIGNCMQVIKKASRIYCDDCDCNGEFIKAERILNSI